MITGITLFTSWMMSSMCFRSDANSLGHWSTRSLALTLLEKLIYQVYKAHLIPTLPSYKLFRALVIYRPIYLVRKHVGL